MNKVLDWIKANWVGMVVGAVIVLVIAGITWPKNKLKDGNYVAVETSAGKYTADELYKALKKENGLSVMLEKVDVDIVNKKYGTTLDEEAKASATEQAESYINQYQLYYGLSEEDFISQSGFNNKDEFITELMNEYKINYYVNEYIAESISEEDLKNYYENNTIGDKEVVMISSVSNKSLVEKAYKALKSGKSIDKVKETYTALTYNEFTLTSEIAANLSDTISSAVKDKKAKSYTKVLTDDSYGYVVVYVKSSSDKAPYEEEVANIKQALAQKKQSEDDSLYYKALDSLRKEYNIKFNDKDYESYYNNFNKLYAAE